MNRNLVLSFLVAPLLGGCGFQHVPPASRSLAELKADRIPYKEGVLVVAGSRLQITLDEQRKPGEIIYFLKSQHGVTFEQEAYRFDSERLSLWQAGGEMYDPVIPLLVDPVRIGDKWSWKGKMTLAADGIPSTAPFATSPASAEVTLSPDKLNMRPGALDSVRVDVMLSMESGGQSPALRKLSFWFVPGQGMMKREFAAASTRLPAEGDAP